MAKNESQLHLVRGIAQSRERKLAGEVGELMSQRASALETVQRLQGYLHEYQSAETSRDARPVMEIENDRRFVKRLNLALEQQSAHAQQLDNSAGVKMQLWQREHANLQALDRLLLQRTRVQSRLQDRLEQKETDALSARATNNGVSR